MNISHIRIANVKRGDRAYCISHVYVNGAYSHDTIEDYDRFLDESMPLSEISSIKVQHKTAIPTGRYRISMNVTSPTFSKKPYYAAFCKGKLPRLDPVKGFSGILIHTGTDENSSSGCLIVGENKEVGKVTNTKAVFERFYRVLQQAASRGESIYYTITRRY